MPKFRPGKHPKGKAARRVVLRTPKAESAPTPEIEETQAAQSETHAQEHDELGRLRGIIFGSLQHDQEQLHTRLENRIAAQAANTRRELEALVARLESRIAEVDSRSIRDQADLREQMQSQRTSLSDAIEERGTQVTQLVTRDLQELQQGKLDHERFSAFLSVLSAHLGNRDVPADAPSPGPAESEAKISAPMPPQNSGEKKLDPLLPALRPLRLGRPPWHPIRAK